jgi:Flp pilus assembly pilin Flp
MIGRLFTPHPLLRRLIADREGATIIEFALVAPVLFLMLFGLFDMAHTQYSNAMLRGAIQKAGRDLTLQSAGNIVRQEAVDARVREQIATVVPREATYSFERLSHFDFSDIGRPEEFTDQNDDDICNNNEPYVDANDNNRWDADRGRDGLGGARDAVLYTASVTYPRLFPMFTLAGLPRNITLEASTVLRNQPFDRQNARTDTLRNCT